MAKRRGATSRSDERVFIPAHSRSYPAKRAYAGPYSQGGVDRDPDYDHARGARPEKVKAKGDRETKAGSFSGSGMSGPLPKPRAHFSALGVSRPSPPRSSGGRY